MMKPCRSKMISLLLLVCLFCSTSQAFSVLPTITTTRGGASQPSLDGRLYTSSSSSSSTTTDQQQQQEEEEDVLPPHTPSLTTLEQDVYDFFSRLHESRYDFRIIVMGTDNGAILETTAMLGPTFKLNESPKSGKVLLTMATADQDFEFHVTLSYISKLELAEKVKPDGSTLRVMRFLTQTDSVICALLLSEQTDDAAEFFASLLETYGAAYTF